MFKAEAMAVYFDKAAQCLIVIAIAFVVDFILKIMIKKMVRMSKDRVSERKANTLRTVLKSVVKYFIIFVAGYQILNVLGVRMGSILAVAGIGGVAIGFGAQSLVKDFITGLFILLEDQFGVGDVITVEGRTGAVETIGLRVTSLRSADGSVHIIPNSQIAVVTNLTKGFSRAIVDVSLSYDENIDKALVVLTDEMKMVHKEVSSLRGMPIVLGVTELGETKVNIRVTAECEPGRQWAIEREMRRMIKTRLDAEGLRRPCPRMSVSVQKMEE